MAIPRDKLLAEKASRMQKLDALMDECSLDALLFTSTAQQAYQTAVKYVTAFPLTTRRAYAFKARGEEPLIIVPTTGHKANAPAMSWIEEENVLFGDMLEIAAGLVDGLYKDNPRVGWAEPKEISQSIYSRLMKTKAEFVDVTTEFTNLRAPKTAFEMSLIKHASDLAVGSFENLIRTMQPGMTEWELLGGASGYLLERGAEELLLLCRSEKPFTHIKRPNDKPLGKTDIFLYSAELAGPGGYWTQVVRPVFMDKNAHPDAYAVWKVGIEAEAAGVAMMRPGKRVCDVHNAIADAIQARGMMMKYWAGHGMGVDLGDGVDIGPDNKMELVPNMILTLHPCIECETDGLLYGNTFFVTEQGGVSLTDKYTSSPFYEDLISEVGK